MRLVEWGLPLMLIQGSGMASPSTTTHGGGRHAGCAAGLLPLAPVGLGVALCLLPWCTEVLGHQVQDPACTLRGRCLGTLGCNTWVLSLTVSTRPHPGCPSVAMPALRLLLLLHRSASNRQAVCNTQPQLGEVPPWP